MVSVCLPSMPSCNTYEMESPSWSTKESEMQYSDAISKTTESSLFVSKANHSISQLSKSMPQPVILKKLNCSMKTCKTFWN